MTLLGGCSGDSTGPSTDDRIAVFANLYVGQPVTGESSVLVTRVSPVLDPYDPENAVIEDAIVTLRADAMAVPETLSQGEPGHYVAPDFTIHSQTTYHMTVAVPGATVITATTTTPDTLFFASEPRALPETMRHAVIPDSFPVLLGCDTPRQILLVDVFCREAWETARYLEPFGNQEEPDDYAEYGGDNGEPRHIFAYMRYEDLEARGDYRVVNFYDAMMVFWGRYTVTIASIDDNTYQYLYRDHPEESGGIRGGIGLFGSAFRRAYDVRIVE